MLFVMGFVVGFALVVAGVVVGTAGARRCRFEVELEDGRVVRCSLPTHSPREMHWNGGLLWSDRSACPRRLHAHGAALHDRPAHTRMMS